MDAGNQSNFFRMLNKDDQDGLFNGLRVRMGVATGNKTKIQDIKNTLVWEQAKGELCCAAVGALLLVQII